MSKHYKPLKLKQLGQALKYQRLIQGITQKEIASMLHIPYQDYQKYEYGLVIPKIDRYVQICSVLDIPLDNSFYLLTRREEDY